MTRLQKLPFDRLSWQNFERLCFRLASRNDQAEDWQRYGRPGQAQSGIDIFVRRADGRYDVWQCKHYRRCGPAQVREAASIFMAGESGLDDVAVQKEVEEQRRHLPALGVVFMAKGGDRLSEELKTHPDIVDDFFGREWVRAVCGEDAVEIPSPNAPEARRRGRSTPPRLPPPFLQRIFHGSGPGVRRHADSTWGSPGATAPP